MVEFETFTCYISGAAHVTYKTKASDVTFLVFNMFLIKLNRITLGPKHTGSIDRTIGLVISGVV